MSTNAKQSTPVMQRRKFENTYKECLFSYPFAKPKSHVYRQGPDNPLGPHKMTQHPPLSPFSNVRRAARVAASKTSSTPSPVKDEHSRYLRAPISCATSLPSFCVVKCCDFFRISSCANGSSRRSFFRPTRIMGTFGHRSLASSTHCQEY